MLEMLGGIKRTRLIARKQNHPGIKGQLIRRQQKIGLLQSQQRLGSLGQGELSKHILERAAIVTQGCQNCK